MASIYLPALDYGDEEDEAPSEALQSLEEKISKLSTDEPSVNKRVPAKEEGLPKVNATVDRNASLASLISEASGDVDTFDIRIADPAPKADIPQVSQPKGVLRKKGKAKAKDVPVESFAVKAAKASATKAHTQYQLVERLLDDACETEEELLNLVLGKFTRDEYKEVIEERYIAGACGNPICRNPAPQDLGRKGKYKIALHQHKVYETPQATRLCSPKCNVVTERVCCALDAGPRAIVDPKSSIKGVPTVKPWDRNVGAVGEGKVVMLGTVKERISSGSPQELTSGPVAAAGAVDGYVPRERNAPKRAAKISEEVEHCAKSEEKERRVSFRKEVEVLIEPEESVIETATPSNERHVRFSEELQSRVSSEVKDIPPSSREQRVSFSKEEDKVLPVARERRVSFSNDVEVVPAAKESTDELLHAGFERHVSFNQDVEVFPAAKESTSEDLPTAREQHVSFSEDVKVFPPTSASAIKTVPTRLPMGPPPGPSAPVLQFNILGLMKEDSRIGESLPGCGMEGMLSRIDNESTPTTPRAPADPPIVGHLPGTNPVDCVVKERVVQAVEAKRTDTTRSPNNTAQGKPLQPGNEGEASAPDKEPVDWDFGDDDDNMLDDDDDVEDLDEEEKQSSKSKKSSREPMPLSRFALLWDLLSNWVTPATGDFLAQRPSYRTADLNAAGDSGMISHTNDITVAVSRNISRYLPSLTRTLQIVMSNQTLEVEIDSLLATFRFRYAAPHLVADRWKLIILILLKSLAKQRLPSLQDHLRREDVHTLLLHELALANTSLEELETFVGMFLDPVT